MLIPFIIFSHYLHSILLKSNYSRKCFCRAVTFVVTSVVCGNLTSDNLIYIFVDHVNALVEQISNDKLNYFLNKSQSWKWYQ